MMLVNVKSALYGMQAALPHFRERGRGHIINVSSMRPGPSRRPTPVAMKGGSPGSPKSRASSRRLARGDRMSDTG